MKNIIWAIVRNTYIETIRERVLYAIVGFSVLVIGASLLAGSISLGQDVRVIKSFSLTSMLIFLLIITIFISTQMFYKETEQKTIYLTLTKPVSRESFYLGKYFGLCLVAATAASVMGLIFLLLLWVKAGSAPLAVYWAIGFTVLEAWLIIALGMLFGNFTSPIASAIYCFALVLIGHSSTTILVIAQKSAVFLRSVLEAVYYLFPNLEKFNLRNEVVYNLHPTSTQTLTVLGYFAGYTALLVVLGILIFRRKEF